MATRTVVRIDTERLARELAVRGWSKSRLASASRIAASTVTSVFNGQPTAPKTLAAIARALSDAPIIPGADLLVSRALLTPLQRVGGSGVAPQSASRRAARSSEGNNAATTGHVAAATEDADATGNPRK